MIPDNFAPNTNPCPPNWSCKKKNHQYLEPRQSALRKVFKDWRGMKELEFLGSLACNEDWTHVCLPDNNDHSLLSAENMVQSSIRPVPTCQKNPCSEGNWPWLDERGFYRCLPQDETVETCPNELKEEDGMITCAFFDLKSVTINWSRTRKCRKGRIFLWGRCVPRWG